VRDPARPRLRSAPGSPEHHAGIEDMVVEREMLLGSSPRRGHAARPGGGGSPDADSSKSASEEAPPKSVRVRFSVHVSARCAGNPSVATVTVMVFYPDMGRADGRTRGTASHGRRFRSRPCSGLNGHPAGGRYSIEAGLLVAGRHVGLAFPGLAPSTLSGRARRLQFGAAAGMVGTAPASRLSSTHGCMRRTSTALDRDRSAAVSMI